MARLHPILALLCAVALPAALGGCAGVLVVGGMAAAGGAGYAAGQERGVNGLANDFAIKTDIQKAFIKADPRLQMGITTNVYEGRVLLTGQIARPELKNEAEQIAGRVNGVRALYDEVQVAPAERAWDDTKDAWITTELRSKLVLDPAIRSVNYLIDTENGSVYLIGSARSQDELDRALRHARYVPGVRRVVSYVQLRSGAPVAAMPARPPGATPAAVPADGPRANPPPAPPAAVEVQKL